MSEFTFEPAKSGKPDYFEVATPDIALLGWVWQHRHDRQWYWRGFWQVAGPMTPHATRGLAAQAMLAARRRADKTGGSGR